MIMNPIDEYLRAALHQRQENNSLRTLPDPRDGIDFCSNDYLGFARLPFPATEPVTYGATGSRLISGNHAAYGRLEACLSEFLNAESALVYGSGYQANLGLISCMASRGDTILYDQLAHASIRDALRLTHARSFAFRHNDTAHLREKLAQATGRTFVVVESVYSMDGDEAPLPEILGCCEDAGAALIIDEAHAVGVLGPQGRGLCAALGLEEKVWARVVTFGKALGAHGAAILGSTLLREYLINFSRPFIYTTGLPPDSIGRIQRAFEYLTTTERVGMLHERIELFKSQLTTDIRNQLIVSRSAIQSLVVPGNEAVKSLATQLQGAGFRILPILHPTVPRGSERLRICLHSFNTLSEVRALADALNVAVSAGSNISL